MVRGTSGHFIPDRDLLAADWLERASERQVGYAHHRAGAALDLGKDQDPVPLIHP
jgi:hypothetical protein